MIALAADHGGLELKNKIANFLSEKNIEFIDFGVFNTDSVDYPDYADKVCESILKQESSKGIIVCGSGVGVSIRANRYIGIRAVLSYNEELSRLSRLHNDANVICLGGRLIEHDLALNLVDVFLNTEFEGERHINRIEKLDKQGDNICQM